MDLTPDLQLELLRWMIRTRVFDELMVATWKQGKGIGGTFSERGHEAISVAAGIALQPEDVVAPMHRDLGTYLLRGMPPEVIFGNLLGKITGPSRGKDANLHGMTDLSLGIVGFISHIPQSLPTSLGVAMAFQYRQEPRVALTFVGDGGSCAGAFHETLNMAALYQAPLVVIIENNQYAYSTPLRQQMRETNLAARAASYGISTQQVDGNNPEQVYQAVTAAIAKARSGGGPGVVEATTMRMLGHAIHDGAEYVPPELLATWETRDPVRSYQQRLLQAGTVTAAQLEELQSDAKEWVSQALTKAQQAPLPQPEEAHTGVYA